MTSDQGGKGQGLVDAVLDAYTEHPAFGYRKMSSFLSSQRIEDATEKRIRLLYRSLGLRGASQKFKTTRPPKGKFQKYPYLLKDKPVLFVNQVWATDITYIRLPHGMVYLVAIIDLYSRKILSWRLSDNMRVERTWKTVKYEFVFLYEWSSKGQLEKGLDGFIKTFNKERPHEALGYQTPDEVYERGCFPVEGTDTVEVA